MLMFLMILLASVPVLLLACVLFAGSAAREKRDAQDRSTLPQAPASEPRPAAAPPRFFAESTPRYAPSRIPVEVLLSRIERHVRLEQAAAESFVEAPTTESLHSGTASPFMN